MIAREFSCVFMNIVIQALQVIILYFGFGYLVSRFFDSSFRNLPFTWLFFTILFLPLAIGLLGNFFPTSHIGIVVLSLLSILLGLAVDVWKGRRTLLFSFLPEEGVKIHQREFLLFAFLSVVFLMLLLMPKESLFIAHNPAIWDDFDRTRSVLSTSFDLTTPKHFFQPSKNYAYYYNDWYIPGIVFHQTFLTLQQTWFLHCIMTYIAVLSFLLYVTVFLFKKFRSRLMFFLSYTFLGGFEYFLYRLYHIPPNWMEWWQRYVPLTKTTPFQVSTFYTLFLWVPQHLLAGICYLMILFLSVQRPSLQQKVMIAILFAGLFGFSAFVFVTATLSYGIVELLHFWKSQEKKRDLGWYAVQALILLLLCLRLGLAELGQEKTGVVRSTSGLIMPLFLFATVTHSIGGSLLMPLQFLLNVSSTWIIILSLDLGVLFILFLCFVAWQKREGGFRIDRSLPLSLLVGVCSTVLLLTFMRSTNSNDLFLRGMIVAQLSMMIAAALFLDADFISPKKVFLSVVAILVVLQCTFILKEFSVRMSYASSILEPRFVFLRSKTPKDAVIFSDKDNCGDVAYFGNRMCWPKAKDATMLNHGEFPHRYFLSSVKLNNGSLQQAYREEGIWLYALK